MTVPRNTMLTGDALERLRSLPAASVHCVVTSPPYFALRNYGAGARELGRESTVDAWSDGLRQVAHEVARVLMPTGAMWLVVGDAYSTHPRLGAPPKSLLLGPERLIRGLLDDGWTVRNRVAWVKTNPLPSPVSDRLSCTWEYMFLLVRQRSYFFDLDAIRIPTTSKRRPGVAAAIPSGALGPLANTRRGLERMAAEGRSGHPLGKNPGDVIVTAASSYRQAHFATFPPQLIRRPILATAPTHVCQRCGRPWRRSRRRVTYLEGRPQTRPLEPCGCGAPTRPGLVLDPFMGAGTTALVARELGRDYLGIELNPAYVELARRRLGESEPAAA